MSIVLHIGAAQGEVDFYSKHNVKNLVYSEPDVNCLRLLKENVQKCINLGSRIRVTIVPRACSSKTGENLNFYANGAGQSSLERPESRTKSMALAEFKEYPVQTITLTDLKRGYLGDQIVDYLCIDTQGHERKIICSTEPSFLSAHFKIIDVELMTDPSQYSVSREDWKHVVHHLLRSGFEPVVHPHGITESYLFINRKYINSQLLDLIRNTRDMLSDQLFQREGLLSDGFESNLLSSLGDHMFLPLTHCGGALHASLLQDFREAFVSNYLDDLSASA